MRRERPSVSTDNFPSRADWHGVDGELSVVCRDGDDGRTRCVGRRCGEDSGREVRQQKHDRRDAALILKLLLEGRFPRIWVPSGEEKDLRQL